MTKILANVDVEVSGEVLTKPVTLSSYGKKVIKRITLGVKRKSGVCDTFYVNYTSDINLNVGDYVYISGDIRTLNNKVNDFVIEGYIFAKTLELLDSEPSEYLNNISIHNAIVDNIREVRKSYDSSNRYVATYKIKLFREHGRYSYFSVTTWGTDTKKIKECSNGAVISLEGRLQEYVSKKTDRLYLCIVTYKLDIEGGD